MAYWPGVHGCYDIRGWYAPISDPLAAYPPLPPGRPPPSEGERKASYALAAVPSDFRIVPVDHAPAFVPQAAHGRWPSGIHAVRLKDNAAKALPIGLLNDVPPSPPQTPSPPKLEKREVSFDDTILKEFCEWADGRRECLSPLAMSDLGFDQWTYELRGKLPPQPDQELALKRRLWFLANQSPLKLWHAIEMCELPTLLGKGFDWVQTPKKW